MGWMDGWGDWRLMHSPFSQILRLRTAIQDYENDKWRLIAAKVGSGFSAAACREKAEEL